MMHHPNMHHQAMSGHPPQHLQGHRAISAHHTMPPPLHGENRHVTITRVALGPGGGAHSLGALGGMPVHPRPHAIRAHHHPPAHHHHPHAPQQMKPLRRSYMGGASGYATGGAPMMHSYAPAHHHSASAHAHHTVSPREAGVEGGASPPEAAAGGEAGGEGAPPQPAAGDGALPGDAPHSPANSKEKTPMCLVNELARYNKIKHQYRLTSETGPAHKKVFTVTLRLGDTEEYTAEGSSIKRAQHAAAGAALTGTRLPAPPPRPAPPHDPPHHHHRHSAMFPVMPTVELNALAMKLCQPAVYTSVPPVPAGGRPLRARWPPFPRLPGAGGALVYRVRVAVGGRAWLGEGSTPQAARHDAAARALHDLRQAERPPDAEPTPPPDAAEESGDPLGGEVKSPVSLVHELALKRNLTVHFTVKSERGPPHMRVFVTICSVGDMETEGEGNGKKVSKRRAAERMLDEMRRRWPPALLRPRAPQDKRRHQPAKKKPRNLIKEAGESAAQAAAGGSDNPISRLAVARHAVRARSPQYRVLEERGAARRREFLVQCVAPPHAATGLGPNKKTAKRRAAHNVLLAMEMSATGADPAAAAAAAGTVTTEPGAANGTDKPAGGDIKRKDSDVSSPSGGSSEVRQPVPGVLLMDYHQRSGQPHPPNGVSETSATGGSGGNTPGAKDQLMYLSQLLGFTVQFSDFPKRNHGEYLSLVSLSTEPPVMCHGGGPSTAHSHEQCSRAALRALALMGLDTMQGAGSKPNVISNGITE